MRKRLYILLIIIVLPSFLRAQIQQEYTSGEIYKQIQKLNFLGSVLYVGAHPDDENTTMISYLSNRTNARVAYLSMNRGDGGQNLLGTEIRELLGVIRTEELLEARKIDHAEQFFTRANDFGFSKNPMETFEFWDRDKVLSDVVWVFRKFRPDVVINRFNHRTAGDTHGHHTASAILSAEAFDLSGNRKTYPNQLELVKTWQPKRLYFNDSWFFYGSKEDYLDADHRGFLMLDLGKYLPIIGKSNTEISALSRSQHKSQGFGSLAERGEDLHFFEPIKGELKNADKNIFAGINTTWSRVEGGTSIGNILSKVERDYDFSAPEKSLPNLLEAYKLIDGLKDNYWRDLKMKQIKQIINAITGLYIEVSTSERLGVLGEKIDIKIEAVNRSLATIKIKEVEFKAPVTLKLNFNRDLSNNKEFTEDRSLMIPDDLDYSDPYWLRVPHSLGMYTVNGQQLIGLPETPSQIVALFKMDINGTPITFERELIYKTATQTQGEIRLPFKIVPDVSIKMEDKVLMFSDNESRKLRVNIKALRDDISGELKLDHPEGWLISPQSVKVNISHKNKNKIFEFEVTPPKGVSEAKLTPEFTIGNKTFNKALYSIEYPHISMQTVPLPAETKVNRIEIKTAGKNIAYIKGAGDRIPEGLGEIGYRVTMLSGKDLSVSELKQYDAVITGIRAYNINDDLVQNQNVLFDYVKQGGTLITQYSQVMGVKTTTIAPYSLELSTERVTDETAKVHFLIPNHPVLNQPNKITGSDFEGWVQERGLYFPQSWDKEFQPILGMHDKGESELKGSLLVAKYGKGHYIYTGLSFFRQLPAGIPGAYRLLANILAL